MLSVLTKYLLRNRRLVLPHVGTVELVQGEPVFDVVEKQMLPPGCGVQLSAGMEAPSSQLAFISRHHQWSDARTREELDRIGQTIADTAAQQSFWWKGIGEFRREGSRIVLTPASFILEGLGAVSAHKPVREYASHNMLVGDNQMTSEQVTDTLARNKKRKPVTMIMGWVLLTVLLALILFFLYKASWNPLSSGLQLKSSSFSY